MFTRIIVQEKGLLPAVLILYVYMYSFSMKIPQEDRKANNEAIEILIELNSLLQALGSTHRLNGFVIATTTAKKLRFGA